MRITMKRKHLNKSNRMIGLTFSLIYSDCQSTATYENRYQHSSSWITKIFPLLWNLLVCKVFWIWMRILYRIATLFHRFSSFKGFPWLRLVTYKEATASGVRIYVIKSNSSFKKFFRRLHSFTDCNNTSKIIFLNTILLVILISAISITGQSVLFSHNPLLFW